MAPHINKPAQGERAIKFAGFAPAGVHFSICHTWTNWFNMLKLRQFLYQTKHFDSSNMSYASAVMTWLLGHSFGHIWWVRFLRIVFYLFIFFFFEGTGQGYRCLYIVNYCKYGFENVNVAFSRDYKIPDWYLKGEVCLMNRKNSQF